MGLFGHSKNRAPAAPAATPRPSCNHSSYSGHREGNKLRNMCSNPACEHTWTEALSPAELGQIKEWKAGW